MSRSLNEVPLDVFAEASKTALTLVVVLDSLYTNGHLVDVLRALLQILLRNPLSMEIQVFLNDFIDFVELIFLVQ